MKGLLALISLISNSLVSNQLVTAGSVAAVVCRVSAVVVGTSMGCAVIWSYVELFGTARLRQAVFVDQVCLVGGGGGGREREKGGGRGGLCWHRSYMDYTCLQIYTAHHLSALQNSPQGHAKLQLPGSACVEGGGGQRQEVCRIAPHTGPTAVGLYLKSCLSLYLQLSLHTGLEPRLYVYLCLCARHSRPCQTAPPWAMCMQLLCQAHFVIQALTASEVCLCVCVRACHRRPFRIARRTGL